MDEMLLQKLIILEPDIFDAHMTPDEVIAAIKKAAAARNLEVQAFQVKKWFFARVETNYRADNHNLVNPLMRAYIAHLMWAKGMTV